MLLVFSGCGIVLAAALISTAAALSEASTAALPQDKYHVKFSPLKAGARTVFVASFAAPFKANGDSSVYYLEAFGPPGCADAAHFGDAVGKGQQVTLSLRRSDVGLPREGVRRWCAGAYIANLVYQAPGDRPSVLLGNFRFRVQ